jgi:hypothetical protein
LLCAALSRLLLVAGVRKSWSVSVGSALGGGVQSSGPIIDGDVLGEDDGAIYNIILLTLI